MILQFRQWFYPIRQWLYPKEFRIKYSGVNVNDFQFDKVINKFEDLTKQVLDSGTGSDDIDTKFVKDIATSVWRLEKRMKGLPDEFSKNASLKPLYRVKDQIGNLLTNREIEIKDYTGAIYDNYELWDEVAGGDVEGDVDKGEVIISGMGKPRIIYKGVVIQRGIPIVSNKEDL